MTNRGQDDWGDDGGLQPQLDAYADARLGADPAARARSRARVMAEARAVSADRRAAAVASARLAAASRQPGPRLVLGRFRMPAAIAATLLLVGALAVGTALAGSGPGGPFYAARLWVEELTLPAEAAARAEAQLARLEARLAEAADAAEAGNGAAVTAALEAYRATVEAALGDAGVDPARREQLAARLGLHVAVLEALVPVLPARASEAVQAAVDRAETRIRQIIATPPGQAPGPPETRPGKPETPPKEPATPKPTPPGKPEATPARPEGTPKPTPPGKPETPPGKPETPPGKPETPPGKPEATPGTPAAQETSRPIPPGKPETPPGKPATPAP